MSLIYSDRRNDIHYVQFHIVAQKIHTSPIRTDLHDCLVGHIQSFFTWKLLVNSTIKYKVTHWLKFIVERHASQTCSSKRFYIVVCRMSRSTALINNKSWDSIMIPRFCVFIADLRVWGSLHWPDPCAAELCRGLDRWEMGGESGWTTVHRKANVLKRQTGLFQVML